MGRYLILGAGKFGRLALARLSREDEDAAFVVVDRDPGALAAARAGTGPLQARWVEAEAGAFLKRHLTPGTPWDWIIPMMPGHAAFAWLRAGPLDSGAWEITPAPGAVADLAPLAQRGPEGELYLSRAAHLCPDDCGEPETVCPVSGESRETPLYAELAGLALPGFRVLVLPSRQLAPGVGGFPPGMLLALARDLEEGSGSALVATACRCHGVVHGVRRKAGGPG